MRQSIINVPQARGARMFSATKTYGVTGLFTHGFSTCNIIAGVSKDRNKVILIHVDLHTVNDPGQIQKELGWLEKDADILLIFRDDGKEITKNLFKVCSEVGVMVKTTKMDNEHDGVLVSLDPHQNDTLLLHPHIKKLPLGYRPDELLCHPMEQRFLAVDKIEQLIGIRAKVQTQLITQKYLLIFDGRGWEPMQTYELTLNQTHPLTQKEIEQFYSSDVFLALSAKLMQLAQEVRQSGIQQIGNPEDVILSIAFWLEGYLNDFDAELLFKRNLMDLFEESSMHNIYKFQKPNSSEDNEYPRRIVDALNRGKEPYGVVMEVAKEYREKAPETNFKKQALSEIDTFSRHYQGRLFYEKQQSVHQTMIIQARQSSQSARNDYVDSNPLFNNRACNAFQRAFALLSLHTTKADEEVAITAFNTGRSLQKINQPEFARFFLEAAVTLRKAYHATNTTSLEKCQAALAECSSPSEISQANNSIR